MERREKEQLVQDMRSALQSANLVVVTKQIGLTVTEVSKLRRDMREAGANYKVLKNTIARIVVDGTPFEGIREYLNGPTAIAFSEDPIAAAKAAVNYSKGNDKFQVLGGVFGEQVLNVDGVKALASLPSLDELRGKLVGLISAPASQIARVVQAPAGQLARVFGAYGSST